MNVTILNDLADAQLDFINTVIAIADENNIDRDDLMLAAAKKLIDVATETTLLGYQPVSETNRDKHWDECRQIAHYDNEVKMLYDQVAHLKGILDRPCGCPSDCSD